MASGQGRGSMSISMKLIRLLIVLLNIAFVVIGAVLLAAGIYLMKDPKLQQLRPLMDPDRISQYSQSLSNIQIFSIVLIVVGSVLLLIGFLGRTSDTRSAYLYIHFFRLLWCHQRFSIFTFIVCSDHRYNYSR